MNFVLLVGALLRRSESDRFLRGATSKGALECRLRRQDGDVSSDRRFALTGLENAVKQNRRV
jgi:hypothetical protein